jgi:hypothetical protein
MRANEVQVAELTRKLGQLEVEKARLASRARLLEQVRVPERTGSICGSPVDWHTECVSRLQVTAPNHHSLVRPPSNQACRPKCTRIRQNFQCVCLHHTCMPASLTTCLCPGVCFRRVVSNGVSPGFVAEPHP